MDQSPDQSMTRRRFLSQTAAGTAVAIAAPRVVTASRTDSEITVGDDPYKYEVIHDWGRLPDRFHWQTTHNVAIDADDNLYVIHEGRASQTDHPSIFVFDSDGRYVRSFGQQFQGGGHGVEVRNEGGQEFLYICAYQQIKAFAKLDLNGEVVWHKRAPMEAGVYADGENTTTKGTWGRNRFMPTNITFLPDGDFLLADGYGSYFIHRFDKEGNWKSCFGGPGKGKGQFNLPHGLWVDDRAGREARLVVADRAHHTLQYLTLDGEYLETIEGFGLPANIDTFENLMVIPELMARVSILDHNNKVVAQLGDDTKRIAADNNRGIRRDPRKWQPGRFVHPHDACFDRHGNVFVAEWVATGRVTKLKRLT